MSTPILGPAWTHNDAPPEVLGRLAAAFAASKGAPPEWQRVAPLFWQLAGPVGVRPEVAFAQACKETGYGRFGRATTLEHRNTCGLKVPDPVALGQTITDGSWKGDADPRAHQSFPTWEIGVLAHLEHLALYAGRPGYPLPYVRRTPTLWHGANDPRHFAFLFGTARTVEALSGKWAPASTYGQSIVSDVLNPLVWYMGQEINRGG